MMFGELDVLQSVPQRHTGLSEGVPMRLWYPRSCSQSRGLDRWSDGAARTL